MKDLFSPPKSVAANGSETAALESGGDSAMGGSDIASTTQGSFSGADLDTEDGLAKLNESLDDDFQLPADTNRISFDIERSDGIDISNPFFCDLLSDKPIAGAEEILSLGSSGRRGVKGKHEPAKEMEIEEEECAGVIAPDVFAYACN